MIDKPLIVFCVALKAEAKPLIDRLGLSRFGFDESQEIYYSEAHHILLLISGIGAKKTHSSLNKLRNRLRDGKLDKTSFITKDFADHSIWINYGVCGHKHYELGSGFLIHKIKDIAKTEAFYPFRLGRLTHFPSAEVHSYDAPVTDYPSEVLVDMEAASFFRAASNFTYHELVALYKVVADNQANPLPQSDKKEYAARVQKLIAGHTDNILDLAKSLRKIAQESFMNSQERSKWISQRKTEIESLCHWTTTQKHQLGHLLQRCYALGYDPEEIINNFSPSNRANPKSDAALLLRLISVQNQGK